MATKRLPTEFQTIVRFLKQGPATALQVASAVGCSKPTAYTRLEALRAKGVVAPTSRRVRDGARGPKARAYALL